MRKAKPPQGKPRPCIVMAMELLGLEEPEMPEGRPLRTLTIVDHNLRDAEFENLLERRLLVVGSRVFRTSPIKPSGTLTFWELLDVVHLQASLVGQGVLLRGAITLGDVIERADLLSGPGLSAAERLSDELADVPRVIVDPRLIRETEQNPNLCAKHHTVPMELGYVRSLLREDADGLWFVDSLKVAVSELDEPPAHFEFLNAHRRQIERRLQVSTTLDGASRSWTWLRSYHNKVVEECFERQWIDEADRAKLLVPARSPLLYVFPPSTETPD